MGGRPIKPMELKKLQGTYRKDRDNSQNIAKFTRLIDAGDPPTWFNEVQKNEFMFISGELIRLNILENVDMNLVLAYSLESSSYFRLKKKIEEEPENCTTQDKIDCRFHLKAMLEIGKEFGLSPISRQKLLIQNKEQPKEDPMAKYLDF